MGRIVNTSSTRGVGVLLVAAVLAAASRDAVAQQTALTPPRPSPAAQAAANSGRPPWSAADVHFMSGMIGHHAQAVVMAGWAASHGATASIRTMAERIVVGQTDEIALMQRWLRERQLPVPEADPRGMAMAGMDHTMLMPGMLTAEQMARLDRARGAEFDRLFLMGMIQHHQGALAMVDELLAANGASQDDFVYKFATDVSADQSTEIERMGRMLAALPSGAR